VSEVLDRAEAWFSSGGPLMVVLLALGLALYGLLFERLLRLGRRGQTVDDPKAHLLVIRAMIGAAPLLGLLGTVNGIVQAFDGMLVSGGVEQMSAGIGRALRTTQYGLTIAAPALLLERVLSRWAERRELLRSEAGAVSAAGADAAPEAGPQGAPS
jgi:hypothetical protein